MEFPFIYLSHGSPNVQTKRILHKGSDHPAGHVDESPPDHSKQSGDPIRRRGWRHPGLDSLPARRSRRRRHRGHRSQASGERAGRTTAPEMILSLLAATFRALVRPDRPQPVAEPDVSDSEDHGPGDELDVRERRNESEPRSEDHEERAPPRGDPRAHRGGFNMMKPIVARGPLMRPKGGPRRKHSTEQPRPIRHPGHRRSRA